MPGRKRLLHDGLRLNFSAEAPAGAARAVLAAELAHGRPYGYAIPPRADAHYALDAITGFEAPLREARAFARPVDRSRLAHLKAIQALDAQAAGAAHREIAAALFGHAAVAGGWSPDGDLRAQVRDALVRGRAYRDGRWRELVWPSARGRFSEDAQSP